MSHFKEKNREHRYALLRGLVFLAYLFFLMYIMFFAEMLGRTDVDREYSYNLQLFREINRFVRHWRVLGLRVVFWNLAGNVMCFMPFGFLVPWLYRGAESWWVTGILSLYLSLLIELTQFFMRVGSFDVDDLLLNTIGGLLGYICYKLWHHRRSK